jgi:hypothetical protein
MATEGRELRAGLLDVDTALMRYTIDAALDAGYMGLHCVRCHRPIRHNDKLGIAFCPMHGAGFTAVEWFRGRGLYPLEAADLRVPRVNRSPKPAAPQDGRHETRVLEEELPGDPPPLRYRVHRAVTG